MIEVAKRGLPDERTSSLRESTVQPSKSQPAISRQRIGFETRTLLPEATMDP